MEVDTYENDVTFTVNLDPRVSGIVKIHVKQQYLGDMSTLIPILEEHTVYVDVNDGVAVFEDTLQPGNYTVTVKYMGDSTFNTNVTSYDFEVKGHEMQDTPIDVSVETNANTVTFNVKVDSQATGFVMVSNDDTSLIIPLNLGEGTLTTTLPYGSYTFDICYLGDENYYMNHTTCEFTLADSVKENTSIELNILTGEDYAVMTVNVNSNATGIVKFHVTGPKEYTVYADINNGQAILEDILESGNYLVTATYMGSDRFNTNSTSGEFTIIGHIKKNTPISANAMINGNRVTLTVTVDENATGFVKMNIAGTIANLELERGVATVTSTMPANSYLAEVTYLGDENFNANSTKLIFTVVDVEKQNTPISIDVKTVENNVTFTVNVNSNATGTVKFQVIGEENYTVYVDVINGEAILEDVLKAGNYTVTVIYNGDSTYNSNITSKEFIIKNKQEKNVTVDVPSDIKAGESFKISIPGATGNITVSIDGVPTTIPLENGTATVSIGDIAAGNHVIEINYPGDENHSALNIVKSLRISKASTKITLNGVSRLAVDYKAGERGAYYYAILKDVDGKVLAGKTCQVALDGKTYTVETNDKGEFGIEISLAKAQTYSYAVSFLGDDNYTGSFASSKLTVNKKKTTIKAKSKKFKAKTKVKKFKVTLKTVKNTYNKKTYLSKGKKLTLTIKGKKYTAKTNKKGVATFKIKKLSKKGKYVAKIKFAGDNTYKASSKKIKLTIK